MTIPQSHKLGPWYGHWRPRSKKWLEKLGLWDRGMATEVKKIWSGDQGMVTARLGQKPERRHPLSIKTSLIDGQRTPALELVPFRSPQIWWRGPEGSEFRVFFLEVCPPSIPCHRICGDQEGNNFNTVVHSPSITGSFDGQWTPAFRFFTQSTSDHTSVSRTGFF